MENFKAGQVNRTKSYGTINEDGSCSLKKFYEDKNPEEILQSIKSAHTTSTASSATSDGRKSCGINKSQKSTCTAEFPY